MRKKRCFRTAPNRCWRATPATRINSCGGSNTGWSGRRIPATSHFSAIPAWRSATSMETDLTTSTSVRSQGCRIACSFKILTDPFAISRNGQVLIGWKTRAARCSWTSITTAIRIWPWRSQAAWCWRRGMVAGDLRSARWWTSAMIPCRFPRQTTMTMDGSIYTPACTTRTTLRMALGE